MQTERGQPIEVVEGYLMGPHTRHNDTQYWRCLLHDKHSCKARGRSEVGSRNIQMTKDHNDHMPDPALVAKYRVATNIKAAARANVLVPSGQILDQHLQGLTQEARLLLRSLWALAFLPPDEVADGYEALVVALNMLNNREVIPLDRLADLQSFIRDYFERNYIRRFNPRGVLVDPLIPPNS